MKSTSYVSADQDRGLPAGKPLRICHYLFAFLSAVLIAGGLQLSPGIPNGFDSNTASELQGHPLAYLLYYLKSDILRSVRFSLQCELTALLLIVLILYVLAHSYSARELLWTLLFSIAFAICVFFGQIFMKTPNWDGCIRGLHNLIKNTWFLAAYGGVCFFGMLALRAWLLSRPVLDTGISRMSNKRRVLVYFLIIMLFWLPVFLIFWPGNLKGDTVVQILQYFHFPTHFQGQWITDGKDVIFTNDHPFIQTLIFGLFMDLGHGLGWNELGVSFYVFLQIAAYGAVISLFLVSLEHFGIRTRLTRIALAVYCLAPPYVVHAILISGDSFLTLFFMAFMLEVFWIYKTEGKILYHKGFFGTVLITFFLFCTSKNQCVYILVLAGFLMVIVLRKEWKRVLAAVLLPLLVFEILYLGAFFRLMHVNQVGTQEALSVFFQQTARTVKNHDKELTKEQKEAIDEVLDYETMDTLYDPDLADPVKMRFNRKAGSAAMRRYFKVWFQMGCIYPGEYIQSFLDSTWGYYYPIKPDQIGQLYWNNYSYDEDIKDGSWVKETVPDSFFKERWFDQSPRTEGLRKTGRRLMILVDELPLIAWLAYPGTVMWILLAMGLLLILARDWKSAAIFFPALLVFGICLLSPKNNNFRYMLPNSFLLPVAAAWVIGGYFPLPSINELSDESEADQNQDDHQKEADVITQIKDPHSGE